MHCSKIQQKLSAYADGEVTQEEKNVISEHLQTCIQCRVELEQLLKISQSLNSIKNVNPPPYLIPHLKQKLFNRRAKHGVRWLFTEWIKHTSMPIFATACVILAITAGSTLGKFIYQIELETTEEQKSEMKRFLGVSSFDEVTQGPIFSSFDNLLLWED
jgi:predicted anti-sigma-YlaC factor YlaD